MEASPLDLEEARCMFEKLIVTRKRELIKLKFIKRLIIFFIFSMIMGSICSYLSIKYESLEKGAYERTLAERLHDGLTFFTFIGYIILAIWIVKKFNKETKALDSTKQLNMKESIEEVKRLDELKRTTLKRMIPLAVLFVICFIMPDFSAISVTTSNRTALLSNETLGNSSTVVNVL